LFKKLADNKSITDKELKYFTYTYHKAANLGKLYLLPKIHKRLQDVPGRPIISNCGAPTEKASEFLDYHLKPLMQAGKSYIRDSGHFLSRLKDLGDIPEGAILVTADVVGLYPSIPHIDGLEALRVKLDTREEQKVPTVDLVNMAEFVLKNNVFEFGEVCKKQVSGTAMGTKFAPPYACIFMDVLETKFLNDEVLKPWCWMRYIDDIFFVWTHGREKLEDFLKRLNEVHPTIKFTHENSENEVNFLDIKVSIEGNKVSTNLFCKPTDCHQFLHYDSCHPKHTKTSTVYSQGLRLRKICSQDENFEINLSNLKGWFVNRGYPSKVVENELKKVKQLSRNDLFITRQRESKNAVPFVVDFCPALESFAKLIRSLVFILNLDPETKAVFSEIPFVSFRSARNLKSYLVRAKLYPKEQKTPGSGKCGKARCQTCNNVEVTNTFESSDGKTFKINYPLDCNSSNIVYLLKCKVCQKRYVGQTTNRFRLRWNNYRSCHKKASKGECVPQSLFHEHFLAEDHHGLEEDCVIKLIDKSDARSPLVREKAFGLRT